MEGLSGLLVLIVLGICLLGYLTSSATADSAPVPPADPNPDQEKPNFDQRLSRALWRSSMLHADDPPVSEALSLLSKEAENGPLRHYVRKLLAEAKRKSAL